MTGSRATLAGAIWLLLLSAVPVSAGDIAVKNMIIEKPWARATPKGAKVGAGYLSLINIDAAGDRLVSASSDVSERVEIHSMTMTNGIMRMRKVAGGLEIKGRSTIDLKPGGLHLMFVGLKQPLTKEQSFNVTMTFEKAGQVDVLFRTTGIGGQSPYVTDKHDDSADHKGSASGRSSGRRGSH